MIENMIRWNLSFIHFREKKKVHPFLYMDLLSNQGSNGKNYYYFNLYVMFWINDLVLIKDKPNHWKWGLSNNNFVFTCVCTAFLLCVDLDTRHNFYISKRKATRSNYKYSIIENMIRRNLSFIHFREKKKVHPFLYMELLSNQGSNGSINIFIYMWCFE